MFGRQTQVVNVHEVMELVRKGEADRLRVSNLDKFLNEVFDEQAEEFYGMCPIDSRTGKPEIPEKEIYTFRYPFVTFNDDTCKRVAEIIGYELDNTRLGTMHRDYVNAVWINEQLKALKEEETND